MVLRTQRSPRARSPRFGHFALLVGLGVLIVLAGCGGSGTSATTGATATGTTATTGVTSATTATTGTTSTASTGQTISGNLKPNVIYFNDGAATAVTAWYINPDGTGQTSYATYNASYLFSAPNPSVPDGASNRFAFVYTDPNTNTVDVYENSTISVSGATRLTNAGFSDIGSLQWAPDGKHLVFCGAATGSDPQLWVVNSDGSGLRYLDFADDCYLAADGASIAYTKVDGNFNGQIYTVQIDGTNIRQVTNDDFDHFNPQWSKDVTRLCYSASPSGNGYDVFTSLPDGTELNQVTNVGSDVAVSPSFGTDGSQVAYVYIPAVDTTKSGVYTVGINGLGSSQVLQDSAINGSGLYWTSAIGTLTKGSRAGTPAFGPSLHLKRLKKLGRWHH